MVQSAEEIYRSSNGDRWTLIRDTDSGRLIVRHEPDLSSGGRVTDTDVDEFLSVAGSGPEFAALRRLLNRPTEPSPELEASARRRSAICHTAPMKWIARFSPEQFFHF